MIIPLLLALSLLVTACGGGGGPRPTLHLPPPPTDTRPEPGPNIDPSTLLTTARFTTHQPQVLEQIGAHHAYARGLTGDGVRIGIQDTVVDYTQTAEFGNRVERDANKGARLSLQIDPGQNEERFDFRPRLPDRPARPGEWPGPHPPAPEPPATCPPGQLGYPPNCVVQPPNLCPPGQVGAPPNCVTPTAPPPPEAPPWPPAPPAVPDPVVISLSNQVGCWKGNCRFYLANSQGNPDVINTFIQRIVAGEDWPLENHTAFIIDEYYDKDHPLERLLRYHEVPSPYGYYLNYCRLNPHLCDGTEAIPPNFAPEAAINNECALELDVCTTPPPDDTPRHWGWPWNQDGYLHYVEKGFMYLKRDPETGKFSEDWLSAWKHQGRPGETHGTSVAAAAAGARLGVAPGATIVPIATSLSRPPAFSCPPGTTIPCDNPAFPDRASGRSHATQALEHWLAALPDGQRGFLDATLAAQERASYAHFDIINRSFGFQLAGWPGISGTIEDVRWYQTNLPRTFEAIMQTRIPDAEKTILVYAAGNERNEKITDLPPGGEHPTGDNPIGHRPAAAAVLPFYFPQLRGHSLAVAATDPNDGEIAAYSNFCGPLPLDWDASRHGRHYCLTAPGTVRSLEVEKYGSDFTGQGPWPIRDGIFGTSFAAPVVSGALALLMEHFRGTRGNTEIVQRMLNTANNRGVYANSLKYGAGLLDLEAALAPMGQLTAGQAAQALSQSSLQAPVAFGSLASRVEGLELAAFDQQNFPFWVPLSSTVVERPTWRSPIPTFRGPVSATAPATGLTSLGLQWSPLPDPGSLGLPSDQDWVAGMTSTSAAIARRPGPNGWGYGLSFTDGEHLGGRTAGAFGSTLRSGMVWTSHALTQPLGAGLTLAATGTMALSMPDYAQDAIFSATPSVMSALSVRVGTPRTGLTIAQPLRAETGHGRFRVENGRIANGRRLADTYRVRLAPNVRELRMTFHHEHTLWAGRMAMEVEHTMHAGHIAGRRDTRLGVAYELVW